MSAGKRQYAPTMGAGNGDRAFPPEAYAYDEDVTPDAVQTVREQADKHLKDAKWEVVDGFGFTANS